MKLLSFMTAYQVYMATDLVLKESGILREEFTVEHQGKGMYTVELAAVAHC